MSNATFLEEARLGFEEAINRQGYGFQHSLIKAFDELSHSGRTNWCKPISEFPVTVHGSHTHIDVILQYTGANLYMIGECKRVNPALGAWCFAARSSRGVSWRHRGVYIEMLERRTGRFYTALGDVFEQDIYHNAVEIRTGERGESGRSGRGAIEEACTQSLRGMNGLMNLFVEHPDLWHGRDRVGFIPAIFTTAKLFVSRVTIDDAELATGNLATRPGDLVEIPWLIYHYPQSQALLHSVQVRTEDAHERSDLAELLYREYMRPIAVVSVSGIDKFMAWQPVEIFVRNFELRTTHF